ncbi:hypothetical protein [Halioxenophilus sp. WMMB6]|uniref:hypothetical protein n=1 Tax=Halioxenophilus sp. WMMB6 TaxID=3073815 RepID=UPI00295EF33C|nr:hypothetical protein [Halioxenophilus sp. WMMB6]
MSRANEQPPAPEPAEPLSVRTGDTLDKILATLIYGVLGFIAGLLGRLFAYPLHFDSLAALAWQTLPWAILGAALFGLLACRYYRLAMALVCFIPSCQFSG